MKKVGEGGKTEMRDEKTSKTCMRRKRKKRKSEEEEKVERGEAGTRLKGKEGRQAGYSRPEEQGQTKVSIDLND